MTERELPSPVKLGLNALWSICWTGFPIKIGLCLLFMALGLIHFETRIGLAFLMYLASPVTVFAMPILSMVAEPHLGEGAGIALLFLICIPIDIWATGVVVRTLFLEKLRLEPPDGLGLSVWIKNAIAGALFMPILWVVVSFATQTSIEFSHSLFETDLLKAVPVAEKIGIELTLWGGASSAVLIVMMLLGVSLVGRVIRRAAQGAAPVAGDYQSVVTRWDLMRVPADQGLMLTATTLVGLVLSMLFWSGLPVSTPHPHECCKPPEVKAAPLYKPVDTLNKAEKHVAQLTAQVEAIEKQKAEEEAAKEKDKGKAGKAKPADAKAPAKAPATP
ncbi:MAG: hypothetical protein IT389_02235 [Nitrospira sp.]|nr:hypothetical protein [Nitrospira sp.]